MESTVGVVETVTTKDGRNAKGPWTLTSAKVGGGWYKTFDRDLGLQLKSMEGDTVELSYTVKVASNPEYSDDLIAQKVKKSEPAPVEANSPSAQTHSYPPSTKDGNIAKAVALKAAVDAIPFEAYGSIDEYVSDVGRLSDCFVGWLQNGTGAPVSPSQGEIDLVVKETQSSLPGTF
jgi:hypothetical protein